MPDDSAEAFASPDLRRSAKACLSYLDLLYKIDALTPVEEITMGGRSAAQEATLELLTKVRFNSVQVTHSSLFPTSNMTPDELLVQRARQLDTSWARIGEALGMTQQGAHKAYSSKDSELFQLKRLLSKDK